MFLTGPISSFFWTFDRRSQGKRQLWSLNSLLQLSSEVSGPATQPSRRVSATQRSCSALANCSSKASIVASVLLLKLRSSLEETGGVFRIQSPTDRNFLPISSACLKLDSFSVPSN